MSLMNSWCEKMFLRRCVAVAAVSSLLVLAACGGDGGTSAPSDDGTSDSEEIQSSSSSQMRSSSSLKTVSSSSSQKAKSSSSVILSADSHEESSSSSSSSLKSVSSSSKQLSSSSSEENGDGLDGFSSSSSVELNCSALLDGETDWNWSVPKECRFNPEIDYGSMTDSRDGQIYKTVKIGDQTWMAENLNYADSINTPSLLERSWCYDDKAENCAVAGRLYTWAAAIDSVTLATDADNPQDCGYGKTCSLPAKVQGVCPDGWHLPTQVEWETLFTEVGGNSTAGKILMSQTGWDNNGNGTDGVGFSALPVGINDRYVDPYYRGDLDFGGDGVDAAFWSASDYSSKLAYFLGMSTSNEYAYLYSFHKDVGYSVRCLKD